MALSVLEKYGIKDYKYNDWLKCDLKTKSLCFSANNVEELTGYNPDSFDKNGEPLNKITSFKDCDGNTEFVGFYSDFAMVSNKFDSSVWECGYSKDSIEDALRFGVGVEIGLELSRHFDKNPLPESEFRRNVRKILPHDIITDDCIDFLRRIAFIELVNYYNLERKFANYLSKSEQKKYFKKLAKILSDLRNTIGQINDNIYLKEALNQGLGKILFEDGKLKKYSHKRNFESFNSSEYSILNFPDCSTGDESYEDLSSKSKSKIQDWNLKHRLTAKNEKENGKAFDEIELLLDSTKFIDLYKYASEIVLEDKIDHMPRFKGDYSKFKNPLFHFVKKLGLFWHEKIEQNRCYAFQVKYDRGLYYSPALEVLKYIFSSLGVDVSDGDLAKNIQAVKTYFNDINKREKKHLHVSFYDSLESNEF